MMSGTTNVSGGIIDRFDWETKFVFTVVRAHWARTKARYERAKEQKNLVQEELRRTCRSFGHDQRRWRRMSLEISPDYFRKAVGQKDYPHMLNVRQVMRGYVAYAAKTMAMYKTLQTEAVGLLAQIRSRNT